MYNQIGSTGALGMCHHNDADADDSRIYYAA